MTNPDSLTPREREVAVLVAAGHTNRRIAEELVIASSTAERHLANILAKLNLRSRAEIAVWAVEHGLARAPTRTSPERSAWIHAAKPAFGAKRNSNLPAELSSFVGRERELRELWALASTTRLLTLTGGGGIGKTRLALRFAADLATNYPDGVWLVRFDALATPDLVPAAVAAVLGVHEQAGRAVIDCLADAVGCRRALLVLDNCEHLILASAELAQALLQACPRLQVVATSREPLNVAGEFAWRVPSLSLPDPGRAVTAEQLNRSEAARLFIERAKAGRGDFTVTDKNAPVVAQVCLRLDGIPLAIELAAVRLKALSIERVAQRLDDSFRLLTGGSRTAMPRQQTLRAAIDWSYDRLSGDERKLFRRLGVFAGGWTLETAEAVCAGDGIATEQVLDLLCSLVDKSLVNVEERDGAERYGVLATIREYAREHMGPSELEAIHQRHADYFAALAEGAAPPRLDGPEGPRLLARLERDHDNLRAALRWLIDCDTDTEKAVQMAGSLWSFWEMHGHPSEGLRWLHASLARSQPGCSPAARARALIGAAALHSTRNELVASVRHARESADIRRSLGDEAGLAESLVVLADVLAASGNPEEAIKSATESAAIRRQRGDLVGTAWSLCVVGNIAVFRADFAAARVHWEDALMVRGGRQDNVVDAWLLRNLAALHSGADDVPRARRLINEALVLFRARGNRRGVAVSLCTLGDLELRHGDNEAGRALLEDSLAWFAAQGETVSSAVCSVLLGQSLADDSWREIDASAFAAFWRHFLGREMPALNV